jgi:pilus assembly protein Flp/PilA
LPTLKNVQNLRDEIKWGVILSDVLIGKCPWGRLRVMKPVSGDVPARGDDPRFCRREVMKKLLVKLMSDDRGGEVLEYALIAGLIVVAAIAVIGTVGTKVLARWTSLNSSM